VEGSSELGTKVEGSSKLGTKARCSIKWGEIPEKLEHY
jgi:hypothetical protein